jgi:5-methylcytosine-specific restriction endonuclease McrA
MITKTAMKKALTEERKSMREKQKRSVFMQRTLSIYNANKKRAEREKFPLPDYTLEEFRVWAEAQLTAGCYYCPEKLTAKSFTVDHWCPLVRGGVNCLRNQFLTCKPCNFQKGKLTGCEFTDLLYLLREFEPVAASDVKRRLTIGGKFLPK